MQKPLSSSRKNKIATATTAYKQAIQRKATNTAVDVKSIYESGGKGFVEAVLRWGSTERGKKLNLKPWYLEYLELVGDYRVHEVYISGCSQIGKSLAVNLFTCYSLAVAKLNILTVYDKEKTLNRNVNLQFKPLIEHWLRRQGEVVSGTKSNSLYQVANASAIFSYASTTRTTSSREGLAAAGSSVVSVTADVLVTDERSQFPSGSADPLPRRLDASQLPSKPQRHAGTPGNSSGIEKYIETCDKQFYPHFTCPHCGETNELHPLGCLLKPVKKIKNGKEVLVWFSESGRPLDWFHHDPEKPVRTAYFGCPNCEKEIPEECRERAFFRCKKSGMNLREFLDGVK